MRARGPTARPVPKTYPHESRGQLSAIQNVLSSSEFPCSTPRPPARVPPSYGGALRGSGRSRFAGSFADLRPPDSPALDLEGLGFIKKRWFVRYLSPLPDSNRGPPPYHSASKRNARARAGHGDHEDAGNRRVRRGTSDREWTRVPALVFPQWSLSVGVRSYRRSRRASARGVWAAAATAAPR